MFLCPKGRLLRVRENEGLATQRLLTHKQVEQWIENVFPTPTDPEIIARQRALAETGETPEEAAANRKELFMLIGAVLVMLFGISFLMVRPSNSNFLGPFSRLSISSLSSFMSSVGSLSPFGPFGATSATVPSPEGFFTAASSLIATYLGPVWEKIWTITEATEDNLLTKDW
jgi:hypothetical protein